MKVLVDESLGLRNGVLLRAAVDAGFEVLVTADKALRHQQNLAAIGIGVVLLMHVRNRIADLRPLVPRVLAAITQVRKGEIVVITGHRQTGAG